MSFSFSVIMELGGTEELTEAFDTQTILVSESIVANKIRKMQEITKVYPLRFYNVCCVKITDKLLFSHLDILKADKPSYKHTNMKHTPTLYIRALSQD